MCGMHAQLLLLACRGRPLCLFLPSVSSRSLACGGGGCLAFGRSWHGLGRSWCGLGWFSVDLESILGDLETICGGPGAVLGRLGAVLGRSWEVLGGLGRTWPVFGGSCRAKTNIDVLDAVILVNIDVSDTGSQLML